MVANINTGICHRRIQEGKPAYFINYTENGENKYEFSSLRFVIEDIKLKLETIIKHENTKRN